MEIKNYDEILTVLEKDAVKLVEIVNKNVDRSDMRNGIDSLRLLKNTMELIVDLEQYKDKHIVDDSNSVNDSDKYQVSYSEVKEEIESLVSLYPYEFNISNIYNGKGEQFVQLKDKEEQIKYSHLYFTVEAICPESLIVIMMRSVVKELKELSEFDLSTRIITDGNLELVDLTGNTIKLKMDYILLN